MSADNGIYIGIFNDSEIRVIHAQAIDNVFYPEGENANYIFTYFRDYRPAKDLQDGYRVAHEWEEEVLNNDFCPILEYGVSTLRFSKSYQEYADSVIKCPHGFWVEEYCNICAAEKEDEYHHEQAVS